jgi:hypothetical protein
MYKHEMGLVKKHIINHTQSPNPQKGLFSCLSYQEAAILDSLEISEQSMFNIYVYKP